MFALIAGALRERGFMLVPRLPIGAAYARGDLYADIVAGLTVAAVLIPQSIAYALLAGLPPAHGLYAALFGGIGGALWGGSRYLATGPIAVVSILTLTAISPLAAVGSAHYVALAAALAILAGLFQIGLGFSRFGFLVRLVPHSVLVGFSSGAAFVIMLTQLPHVFGIPASGGAFAFDHITNVFAHLPGTNIATLLIFVSALSGLMILRSVSRRIPGNLAVLSIGIAASYLFDLPSYGVTLAGEIPVQFPTTGIPEVSATQILALSGHALVLSLVGFMSAYATVKEFSQKTREKVNADQELLGQGIANVLSGLFRGHPVGGSLSRTAVNYEAGARTAWSGVYSSLLVIVVILFFSGVLSMLPIAVLAAILIFAVVPLIDITELRRMYQITHTDGVIGAATFVSVFFLRLDQAILFGVILALVLYMHKVMWVHVKEVGFHPQWLSLVARDLFPQAEVFPSMLILRIDAPIFYANVERLTLEIEARLSEYTSREGQNPKILALDFSGVNHMDVTGVEEFGELVSDLHARHIKMFVITPRRGAREVLERGHIAEHVRFVHGTRELRLLGESFKHNTIGGSGLASKK